MLFEILLFCYTAMISKVWKKFFPTTLFACFLVVASSLLNNMGVVVTAIKCNSIPSSGRHVEFGFGRCVPWGPYETDYECCLFCHEENKAIAVQYVKPGGMNPFSKRRTNNVLCCCYQGGQIKDGRDGTQYYF